MFRRGQSCGGGYSSLGYLFGGDDKPPPRAVRPNYRGPQQRSQEQPAQEQDNLGGYGSKEPYSSSNLISPENERPAAGIVYHDERYDTSEGRMGRVTNNNYHRPDSQNCGNFITVSVLLLYAFN
jgi:SPIRAL1-like protein